MSTSAPAFLLALIPMQVHSGDRVTGRAFATRSEVLATHGMVATSQPLATQAALDVLQAGGNAIDAAITANAVLALVEPTGCGLGGDLFALVWSAKDQRLYGLNASGRSPQGLTAEILREKGLTRMPSHGPLPVTVPGCVDGWFALHGRFGSRPMKEVLAPAVRYAREGFPLSQVVAFYWERNAPVLEKFPGFEQQFMPGGRAPREGEVFKNPGLADTLTKLGEGGRDAFYRGPIARAIVSYVKENGGYLSEEDLAAHGSEWTEPVSTRYRGYDVWELPPNGQGIAALQILNLIEPYDVAKMGFGSADWLHLFTEAKKLAFADRARWHADPAFCEIPVRELVSKEYAKRRGGLIDMEQAALAVEAGDPRLSAGDTIYLTTADDAGNMVSLIQSNFRGMGSGMTPPGLGFVLQDRGELFDLEPGRFNSYAPLKRPFHTIIPAFVTKDGKPWMSFGVMGGDFQPQGHVQILVYMLDFGMNTQEAGDAPRVSHDGSSQPTGERMEDGGELSLETGFDPAVRAELEERGHVLGNMRGGYGGYQAIRVDIVGGVRVYRGASEMRKDGQAAGY